MLNTQRSRKRTIVISSCFALLAVFTTVAVRAQQSPATTPTAGSAAPAVTYVQPTRYVQPTQYVQPVQYVQPTQYVQPVQYAQPTRYVQPTQYVQQAAAPAATSGGDVYGFTAWLNGVRAQYGLPAVGYDANLEAWAQQNNSQQNARGIGHFVMGPARRQNSAMGNYASIGAMWLNSPAHRAALLDPTIRFIGIAGMGAYWTFNAY